MEESSLDNRKLYHPVGVAEGADKVGREKVERNERNRARSLSSPVYTPSILLSRTRTLSPHTAGDESFVATESSLSTQRLGLVI